MSKCPEDNDFCTVEFPSGSVVPNPNQNGDLELPDKDLQISKNSKCPEEDGFCTVEFPSGSMVLNQNNGGLESTDKDLQFDGINSKCSDEDDFCTVEFPTDTLVSNKKSDSESPKKDLPNDSNEQNIINDSVPSEEARENGRDAKQLHQCPHCPEQFTVRRTWKFHVNRHKYQCPFCDGKNFSRRQDLDVHIRRHTGEKPFQCNQCDKRFVSQQDLKKHAPFHSDNLQFACGDCDEKFKYRTSLINHRRVHSGDMLQCDICHKEFKAKHHLQQHYRLHTGEKPFGCSVCGKTFATGAGLRSHKFTHNKDTHQYVCEVCGRSFGMKSNYTVHFRVHSGEKPYSCRVCGNNFKSHMQRKQHEETHRDIKSFMCGVCGKGFSRKMRFKEHQKRYHGNIIEDDRLIDESFLTSLVSGDKLTKIEPAPDLEGKQLVDGRRLKPVDITTLQEAEDEVLDEAPVSADEIKPNNPSDGFLTKGGIIYARNYVTGKMQKAGEVVSKSKKLKPAALMPESESSEGEHNSGVSSSSSESDSEEDVSAKTTSPPPKQTEKARPKRIRKPKHHVCPLCDKVFTHTNGFNVHVQRHKGLKNNKCAYCEKYFVTVSDVRIHERVHTGEAPYQCDKCPAKFKYRTSFCNHKRIHTGDTFDCEVCKKKCVSVQQLETHARIHTGDKPYKCTQCDKVYGSQAGLRMHRLKHSGETGSYMCDVCGKCFPNSSNLERHYRVHTGEKPYLCRVCGKGFKEAQHQRNHEQIHSDIKAYVCKFCSRGFSRKDRLNAHVKKCKHKDGVVLSEDTNKEQLATSVSNMKAAIKTDNKALGNVLPSAHPKDAAATASYAIADVVKNLCELPTTKHKPGLVGPGSQQILYDLLNPSAMMSQHYSQQLPSTGGNHYDEDDYVSVPFSTAPLSRPLGSDFDPRFMPLPVPDISDTK